MKTTVFLVIEEGRRSSVKAEAYDKKLASITIEAATMKEAQELLPQGEAAALEAMRTWTPEPKEPVVPKAQEKDQEHYKISPITKEEAAREMADYEATTTGSRFKRSIELSADFRRKNEPERSSLGMMQIRYLSDLAWVNDVYHAIEAAYDLAFRKGYLLAKNQKK